ncbi:MAG: type III-A CRISPR-associated protein Cas10/Csm1 [Desulfurobacteriaceae bacterium]
MSKHLGVITFVALLHDIGKVKQRAEKKKTHYEYSAELIKENLHQVLKKSFGFNDPEIDRIAELAGKHHENLISVKNKNDYDLLILKKADGLSSGLDREYFENYDKNSEKEVVHSPIISIFSEISYDKRVITPEDLEYLFRYKVEPLTPNAVYPAIKEELSVSAKDYEKLLNGFLKESQKIPSFRKFSFDHNLDALKSLIVKYFWSVPSYTYHPRNLPIPDVPLADHLLTTSAIATALKIYYQEKGYEKLLSDNAEEEKFILLSCDFSGIQSFIFQEIKETKKFAAKLLRARSLSVSLAIENLISEIISAFKGNSSLVLFNAGGKAWVLLPNLEGSNRLLDNLKKKISQRLLRNYYGDIKIKIAYVKLKEKDLYKENYQEKIKELFKEEQKQRFKLFDKWILSADTSVQRHFLKDIAKEDDLCEVCKVRKGSKVPGSNGNKVKVCRVCYNLLKLGEKIPKLYARGEALPLKTDENLWPFFKLCKDGENPEVAFSFSYSRFNGHPVRPMASYIPMMNENDLKENWRRELIKKLCFDNKEEDFVDQLKNKNPKTFCHIGIDSLHEEDGVIFGRPYLGVLKADVDALGYIFSNGFCRIKDERKGKEQEYSLYSLSRVVYLSRMIDYFFSQIIPLKILSEEEFKNIYSVFAGGDDLFLIGDWYSVVKLARRIKEEFGKFVGGVYGGKPSITISIGVEFFNHHTPVYRIAELGESALEKAKSVVVKRKINGKEKVERGNSIVILGQRIRGYKGENLEILLEIARKIEELLKEGVLTTSLLYRILEISQMANAAVKSPRNLLWRPLLYYLILRNANVDDEKKEVIRRFLGEPNVEEEADLKEKLADQFITWIEHFSENLSEEKEEKGNLFYIPLVIALYRRRRYGKAEGYAS